MAQETMPDKVNSLEKLTVLRYTHEKLPEHNTAITGLNETDVPDSREKSKEKFFKMDSLRLTMKVLDPDLWKKYKLGHFECSLGASYVFTGSLAVISGLVVNLATNSRKQTAEEVANQKRNGRHLMIAGGVLTAIGIPLFTIGINKQQAAIRDCTKRVQDRAKLQVSIMPSGGFALALKF
jgi:uncharacterized protein YjeT (DUF2065 family)